MGHREDLRALERSLAEPAAFDALFLAHLAIRRYLHARLGDPSVAEKLAAETFLRAFAARPLPRPGARVRARLLWIATNLLRDELHARGRRDRGGPLPAAADVPAPGLPADAELSAALAVLPREQLEVLLLHAWADLGYAEIAEALGVRVGTVRSRLHRARAALLAVLDPQGDRSAGSRSGATEPDHVPPSERRPA